MINRLLDGFEGKPTSSKYEANKVLAGHRLSRYSGAGRAYVLDQNPEGGRSTSYSLAPLQ